MKGLERKITKLVEESALAVDAGDFKTARSSHLAIRTLKLCYRHWKRRKRLARRSGR